MEVLLNDVIYIFSVAFIYTSITEYCYLTTWPSGTVFITPQTLTLDSHDNTKASYVWHYKEHATKPTRYINNRNQKAWALQTNCGQSQCRLKLDDAVAS